MTLLSAALIVCSCGTKSVSSSPAATNLDGITTPSNVSASLKTSQAVLTKHLSEISGSTPGNLDLSQLNTDIGNAEQSIEAALSLLNCGASGDSGSSDGSASSGDGSSGSCGSDCSTCGIPSGLLTEIQDLITQIEDLIQNCLSQLQASLPQGLPPGLSNLQGGAGLPGVSGLPGGLPGGLGAPGKSGGSF